jgi:hypothetical protein
VLLVPGCFWVSETGSESAEASYSEADAARAESNVRASIPAIEAYYADNNTYVGITPEKLRAKYDYGLPVFVVVSAKAKTYCIEGASGRETFHYAGPGGPVQPGGC